MQNNRLIWLDELRCLAILLVVAGHCLGGIDENNLVHNIIYLFHMPLMFVISGFCSKHKYENKLRYILKNFISLYIPYLFWSIIFWNVNFFIYSGSHTVRIKDLYLLLFDFRNVWVPGWYLLVLFLIKVIDIFISFLKTQYQLFFWLILFIVGFFIQEKVLLIDRVCLYGIIFYTGKRIKELMNYKWHFSFLFIVLLVCGFYCELKNFNYFSKAFIGVSVSYFLFLLYQSKPRNVITDYLAETIGKYSMITYVLHGYFTVPIKIILKNLNILYIYGYAFAGVCVSIIFTILICSLLKKYSWIELFFYPEKILHRNKKMEVENMTHYNFIIVGAGLFSATLANAAIKAGKKCLIIEKRSHIAGNIYTENEDGINVHKYGAHIFHTDSKEVWNFVNQFAEFNRYTNCPVANYKGTLYNLPFNMNTFTKIWSDVITPEDAKKRIAEQAAEMAGKTPQNLEEQAISLVGRDIYERLIKGYTEKQWGRDCTELPASIIKRLPVRLTFDNNYFNDRYQGIPIGGYTKMIEKMFSGCDIQLNTDFFADKEKWLSMADKVIYTGTIDRFFDYKFGELEYRSLRFETEKLPVQNYQGNAVINYTDSKTPFTRIIEHKHFEPENNDVMEQPVTYITREYPATWKQGDEPYYAVNDERNSALYAKYKDLADKQNKVIFGGRLGMYKYFDMDDTILAAWDLCKKLF